MIARANKTLILDGQAVQDSKTMEECYRARYHKYGWSSGTLFYSKSRLHEKRLAQAKNILQSCLTSSDSFLDAGCGFGDLIPHMPPCEYHGIDIILSFIEEARRRYPDHLFSHVDMTTHTGQYTWVAMVGVLGTMPSPEDKIRHCCSLAGKGLVLDILDAAKYNGGYNRFRKEGVHHFLLQQGFTKIGIVDDPGLPWTFFCGKK